MIGITTLVVDILQQFDDHHVIDAMDVNDIGVNLNDMAANIVVRESVATRFLDNNY